MIEYAEDVSAAAIIRRSRLTYLNQTLVSTRFIAANSAVFVDSYQVKLTNILLLKVLRPDM